MATLAPQSIVLTGLNPSYAAASAGGDEFVNDGKKFLHVKNGGAGAINVTAVCQTACNYGTGSPTHDDVVAVPAAGERIIGPFPPGRFNDGNGKVQITYSGVTSLTVALLSY